MRQRDAFDLQEHITMHKSFTRNVMQLAIASMTCENGGLEVENESFNKSSYCGAVRGQQTVPTIKMVLAAAASTPLTHDEEFHFLHVVPCIYTNNSVLVLTRNINAHSFDLLPLQELQLLLVTRGGLQRHLRLGSALEAHGKHLLLRRVCTIHEHNTPKTA
jgi:hypothetical protein